MAQSKLPPVRATGLQVFDVAHKPEGARAADLTHERLSREIKTIALRAGVDSRVVEVDGEVRAEPVMRGQLGPLVAIFNAHGLFQTQEFLRRVQLFDAGIQQQEHERTGAAVHDWDFSGVDFDDDVVDAQPSQRGVEVLNGRNTHVMLIHRASTEHGITHGFCISRKINRWIQVSATIDDPGISRRWAHCQRDFLAGMQTDASRLNNTF